MTELTIVAAILGITLCEITALLMGIDGIILTASIGAIAALGGYQFAKYRAAKRGQS